MNAKIKWVPVVAVAALAVATVGVCVAAQQTDAEVLGTTTVRVQEDDPSWDCRIHGDLTCGPTNAQGVAAGLYRDGELFATWEELR